jgi:hypothetical protein
MTQTASAATITRSASPERTIPARSETAIVTSIASRSTDLLFMLGMVTVGVAVILGIGLRVSAVLSAGDSWGFGISWKRLHVVQNHRWLI